MTPERWTLIKEIFEAATGMAPGDRPEFLQSRCGADADLRADLERLLSVAETSEDEWPADYLEPGELLQDRFEIRQRLEPHGSIYSALDRRRRDAPVAIRTISSLLTVDPPPLAQLQHQLLVIARVAHPHICRVLQVDFEGGPLPYYAMEWLDGETLAQRLWREGGMTAREAIPLIRQMAAGLDAAGMVHRNFCSRKVMLTSRGAVITDFGRRPNIGEASAAKVLAHASPEEVRGEEVTPAGNVYSFGMLMYEMAAGTIPLLGNGSWDFLVQRSQGAITPVGEVVPGIDERWAQAIDRCLERNPARRFADAAAIAGHFAD